MASPCHERLLFGGCLFKLTVSWFLLVSTVSLYSSPCSCIHMKQTSYRGFPQKNEKRLGRSFLFHIQRNRCMSLHLIIQSLVFMLIASIPLNLNKRISQIQLSPLHNLIYIQNVAVRVT